MKRTIALILAFVLSLLALTGCGTYDGITKPPKPGGSTGDTNGGTNTETPDVPKDTTPFTVTIVFDDAPYVDTDGMYAQWTREGEIHRAEFIYDETTGISTASITGLDGDYAVTLLNLSSSYMYDANAYTATSNRRHTVIEVFKFIKNGTKTGSDYYENVIKISRVGAYTATITQKQPYVYYEFTPTSAGTYTITTICDTNANDINPSFDIYTGSSAFRQYSHTVGSGGSEASYTRNVKYEYTVLKGGESGQNVAIKITANQKDGVYPINVSFIVRYEATDESRDDHGIKTNKLTFEKQEGVYTVSSGVSVNAEQLAGGVLYNDKMEPAVELNGKMALYMGNDPILEFTFTRTSVDDAAETVGSLFVKEKGIDIGVGGTYIYVIDKDGAVTLYYSKTKYYANEEALAAVGEIYGPKGTLTYPEVKISDGIYKFDGSMFGLGDDGFYHLYNESTGKYDGPTLYARLRTGIRFVLDYQPPGAALGYDVAMIGGYRYVCKSCGAYLPNSATSCSKCGTKADCFNTIGFEGTPQNMLALINDDTEDYTAFIAAYGDYIHQETNPDGVYPVTEDLKGFLQKFAIAGTYFMDGNGFCETYAESFLGYRIYAAEEDQWLFACCYYV